MQTEAMLVSDLAKELRLSSSYLRRFILAHDFNTIKVKVRTHENLKNVLAVSLEDADKIRLLREGEIKDPGLGVFYVIQPVPELAENRLKLGFSRNIDNRLRCYRTINPNATIVKTFPCRVEWERAVLDFISKIAERLSLEVFEVSSVDMVLEDLSVFFAMMPSAKLFSDLS